MWTENRVEVDWEEKVLPKLQLVINWRRLIILPKIYKGKMIAEIKPGYGAVKKCKRNEEKSDINNADHTNSECIFRVEEAN